MDQRLSRPRRFTLEGSIRIFFAESLVMPTGFIVIAILTRSLGAEQYGLYILAFSIVGWIEISLNSLFKHSSILVSSESQNVEATSSIILRSYLIAGISAGLLLLLFSHSIATLFDEPRLTLLLRFFSLDIPLFAIARAYRAVWIGTGNFTLRATMSLGRWLVRLALIALLIFGGLSLFGALLANIGATLFEAIFGISKKRINPFTKSVNSTRTFYSAVRPLALFVLTVRLFSNLDLLSLKVLGSSIRDVGYYGAAQNLAIVPGIIAISFSLLLLSTLNKILSKGEIEKARYISSDALRLAVGLLPFAALIAGSAGEIVAFVLGKEFNGSAPLLRLLIFAAVFQTSFSITSVMLMAAKKGQQIAKLAITILILSISAYSIFVPQFGSIAAAWTITLTTLIAAISSIFLIHKYWKILTPSATLARAMLLSILVGIMSTIWTANGVWSIVEFVVLSIFILGGFVLMGELSESEKKQVRKLYFSILKIKGNG